MRPSFAASTLAAELRGVDDGGDAVVADMAELGTASTTAATRLWMSSVCTIDDHGADLPHEHVVVILGYVGATSPHPQRHPQFMW
uniref:Uncharacterized protein n=1 Tax=Oryza barthii TaxID=65489 RepID=A0A0D3GM36_9ORYZ